MIAGINPLDSCKKILSASAPKDYNALYQRHRRDFQIQYDRCQLRLGDGEGNNDKMPADARLEAFRNGSNDPGLMALYFNYGRYLLISSSRKPARLPANLQGKWNEHMDAPWQSDYHTNINLQMNYWPADLANTGKTFESLAGFMKAMLEPGLACAKNMYGADGWAMHHVTDIYGRTAINADPSGVPVRLPVHGWPLAFTTIMTLPGMRNIYAGMHFRL